MRNGMARSGGLQVAPGLKSCKDCFENTVEYHLPGHNYAGPGTHVKNRVLNRVKPTTALDTAALIHDIEYLYLDQDTADKNFRDNLFRNGNYLLGDLSIPVFGIKNLVGYDVKKQKQLYHLLRKIAERELIENPNFKFVNL